MTIEQLKSDIEEAKRMLAKRLDCADCRGDVQALVLMVELSRLGIAPDKNDVRSCLTAYALLSPPARIRGSCLDLGVSEDNPDPNIRAHRIALTLPPDLLIRESPTRN